MSSKKVDRKIGSRVRLFREEKGLDQAVLASQIGVAVSELHALEEGSERARPDVLLRIASQLNIEIIELFSGSRKTRAAHPPGFRETTSPIAPDAESERILLALERITDPDARARLLELIELLSAGRPH